MYSQNFINIHLPIKKQKKLYHNFLKSIFAFNDQVELSDDPFESSKKEHHLLVKEYIELTEEVNNFFDVYSERKNKGSYTLTIEKQKRISEIRKKLGQFAFEVLFEIGYDCKMQNKTINNTFYFIIHEHETCSTSPYLETNVRNQNDSPFKDHFLGEAFVEIIKVIKKMYQLYIVNRPNKTNLNYKDIIKEYNLKDVSFDFKNDQKPYFINVDFYNFFIDLLKSIEVEQVNFVDFLINSNFVKSVDLISQASFKEFDLKDIKYPKYFKRSYTHSIHSIGVLNIKAKNNNSGFENGNYLYLLKMTETGVNKLELIKLESNGSETDPFEILKNISPRQTLLNFNPLPPNWVNEFNSIISHKVRLKNSIFYALVKNLDFFKSISIKA